jgi:hypothetical protein
MGVPGAAQALAPREKDAQKCIRCGCVLARTDSSVREVLSQVSTVGPEPFGSETCRRDLSTNSGRVVQGRTAHSRGQPQMSCYRASIAVFTDVGIQQ